ncbi:MarR family transcriptional regulator [Herbiconiux sp. CPCC 205763]|uniref:MarR family transcriptional regulator n=1 Tax=Herbiconiux aconitum TaxID=2970913 RepID=A0ABT2GN49_9MICO|nr:MarR family transcriptional regulator [Herbiconiux aconitum]MCS5717657.1 MarR family transcriptional regulator [Herbiconiux aconitum]
MTDALDENELGAYFALVAAGDLIQRAVTTQLGEHGLSPLQFSVLARLLDAPAGLRMSELADVLVVSRSGLTYQITQLEKSGLVERASSPGDDRGVVATLTATGRDRVLGAFPGHVALVRENFLDFLQPGEADAIRVALERVVESLRGA